MVRRLIFGVGDEIVHSDFISGVKCSGLIPQTSDISKLLAVSSIHTVSKDSGNRDKLSGCLYYSKKDLQQS